MVLPELRQAGPSTAARTVMSPAAEETLTTGCSGTSHHWQPARPELEAGVIARISNSTIVIYGPTGDMNLLLIKYF